MDYSVVLEASAVATICSAILTFIFNRKGYDLQYITSERKEWREKIREIADGLNGATYNKTCKLLGQLKGRINAFGINESEDDYLSDSHIWKVIHEIEDSEIDRETLAKKQRLLMEYLSLLLKYDWERSKKEIKFDSYKVLSFVMFIATFIYFIMFALHYNVYGEDGVFIQATSLLAFVGAIIMSCLIFYCEIKLFSKDYFCGSDCGKFRYVKKIVIFTIFVITSFSIINSFWRLITQMCIDANLGQEAFMCKVLLMILYVFGFIFIFISQYDMISMKIRYQNSINGIRTKTDNQE